MFRFLLEYYFEAEPRLLMRLFCFASNFVRQAEPGSEGEMIFHLIMILKNRCKWKINKSRKMKEGESLCCKLNVKREAWGQTAVPE